MASPTKQILKGVKDLGEDGMAAMEAALLELTLFQLHRHRTEIRRAGHQAVKSKKSETSKLLRAVTKTTLQTGEYVIPREKAMALMADDPLSRAVAKTFVTTGHVPDGLEGVAKDRTITIPEYKRQDGTVVAEHTRTLPEGQSARAKKEREDIERELGEARDHFLREERKAQRAKEEGDRDIFGPRSQKLFDTKAKMTLDAIDAVAEIGMKAAENETYNGAIRSFLHESSLGQGIVAVADYFSKKGSKLQFAAKAIAEFGPVAGARIAYSYFRYGGYDVPMKQDGNRVVTEMGDTLPKPTSAADTRNWAIKALEKRLPSREADDSGAEPPSEGFLIDRDGNVLAHAVGRGNDHFLPFSVKHLRQMRKTSGAEYVRRRMFGGPTVEDLHAAMMMGADKLTVVSNSGTYTMGLSGRSHGIKMEHMQILQRYQDILDKSKRLDHAKYDSAMDALQSEFPLHIFKETSKAGAWKNDHDRIAPKNRFMDQLRRAFDRLGGEDEATRNELKTIADVERTVKETGRLPGMRSSETTQQFYRRMVGQTGNRQGALQQVEAFYRAKGTNPSDVGWLKDERIRVRQPSSATRTIHGERVEPPRPVSVRSSYTDPAAARARVSQPQASVTMPRRARSRLEELGIDPEGYSTSNSRHAKELAMAINSLPDQAWMDTLDDKDFLNDLTSTFSEIRT